jgi:hypothetical protein
MDFVKWLIVVAVVGAARVVAQIFVALGWIAVEEMEILRKIHFWAMVALTVELAVVLVIKMAVPALEVWKKPNEV